MRGGLLFLLLTLFTSPVGAEEPPVAIALHGGAGTIERARMTPEQPLHDEPFI